VATASCRYADDCNIYIRSHRAGERVMASVSRFLTTKLRLKVNETKSAVARPEESKFLGSASRMTAASGVSRQRPSTHSRRGSWRKPAGRADSACRRLSRN
jgi:hypothetical protein